MIISSLSQPQETDFFIPENQTTIIDSLNHLEIQDPNLALRLAFKVLDKYPIDTKDKTILKVYNVIGQIYLKKGLSVQALQYFMEVERESIRINNGSYWNLINIGNDVDPNDPNGDNWNYDQGSLDYSKVNGTEGNGTGSKIQEG